MTGHKTGTREEWLAGRLELLAGGREQADPARRRAVPAAAGTALGRVGKAYRFETDEGPAPLADLFRGRSQLLVYHSMFGSDYTAGCPSCSAIADGFDGFAVHLANHDVTLCAVSRAPLENIQAYKRRMGWSFPLGVNVRQRLQPGLPGVVHPAAAAVRNWRLQLPPDGHAGIAGGGQAGAARRVGGYLRYGLADIRAGAYQV